MTNSKAGERKRQAWQAGRINKRKRREKEKEQRMPGPHNQSRRKQGRKEDGMEKGKSLRVSFESWMVDPQHGGTH